LEPNISTKKTTHTPAFDSTIAATIQNSSVSFLSHARVLHTIDSQSQQSSGCSCRPDTPEAKFCPDAAVSPWNVDSLQSRQAAGASNAAAL
jgi:hypothetical protein